MKLIVGLGNFPKEYDNTRHNIGFYCIDQYCKKIKIKLTTKKNNGLYYAGKDYIIAKPLTYMNLSGDFIRKIIDEYQISSQDVLVICDDIYIPLGEAKFKTKGSAGGQNGIKSIINSFGHDNFSRLKIGVGLVPNGMDLAKYVLDKFNSKEKIIIKKITPVLLNIIKMWMDNEDMNKIMQYANDKNSYIS